MGWFDFKPITVLWGREEYKNQTGKKDNNWLYIWVEQGKIIEKLSWNTWKVK
jgi:hypothetical protein